ncbi:MAG: hypothetical protein ACXVBJ_12785 [Flavisolibacter sp.]
MKKIIVCSALCLSIAVFASAQTTSTNKRSSGRKVSTSSHTAKRTTSKITATATTTLPDNRKEYMKDGQLATPTGHQATPINSDEYQSPRDSDARKPTKH